MEKEQKKNKNYLQAAMLFLMIIVFPGGSWVYMNLGYNRSKTALAELQDYGHLPAFQLTGVKGTVDSSLVNGQMTLVAFVNPTQTEIGTRMEVLETLHRQFDERNDFKLLIHLPETTNLASFQKKYKLEDDRQIYAVKGNTQTLGDLIKNTYRIPDLSAAREPGSTVNFQTNSAADPNNYPYYILIDEKGKIRNYYHADRKVDIERMVEHIALILPRDIEGDPRLRRDREL